MFYFYVEIIDCVTSFVDQFSFFLELVLKHLHGIDYIKFLFLLIVKIFIKIFNIGHFFFIDRSFPFLNIFNFLNLLIPTLKFLLKFINNLSFHLNLSYLRLILFDNFLHKFISIDKQSQFLQKGVSLRFEDLLHGVVL